MYFLVILCIMFFKIKLLFNKCNNYFIENSFKKYNTIFKMFKIHPCVKIENHPLTAQTWKKRPGQSHIWSRLKTEKNLFANTLNMRLLHGNYQEDTPPLLSQCGLTNGTREGRLRVDETEMLPLLLYLMWSAHIHNLTRQACLLKIDVTESTKLPNQSAFPIAGKKPAR